MTSTDTDRRDGAALAWVEQHLGGRIVTRTRDVRWRPQWFLDVETPAGIQHVVLRGYRNPGYVSADEAGSRATLTNEAQLLEALQRIPVPTPTFYGYNADLGWLAMERLPGEADITALSEPDRVFTLMQEYMAALATMHELPSERPLGLALVDVGPNQFMFDGDRLSGFIDVEFGRIGDPLMEIGMMRVRDVHYHVGRMAEHVTHYGECYEKLTGIALDEQALKYWTIAGPTLFNTFTLPGIQRPDATLQDAVFAFAFEVQQKRALLEALAEWHGFDLDPPELTVDPAPPLGPLHGLLLGQLEGHYTDDYSRDLPARVNFLYRVQRRREFLIEPMQRATGVSVGHPLEQLTPRSEP